jgi:heme exporter protein D
MLDLDAGKYAAFVWPAYALTAAVFVGMVVFSLNQARRWRGRAEKTRK